MDFSFVFSAPLHAWRNLFSASGTFCGWREQPSCNLIFWPAEGTSLLVKISKKWKNPSSALRRKRSWVQALPWFEICAQGRYTHLKSPYFAEIKRFSDSSNFVLNCCSTTYPVVLSDVFFLCDFLCSSWWLQDLDFSATVKKYQNIQPVLVLLLVVVILVSGKMSCKIFHTRMQNTFSTNKIPKHLTCFGASWFCSDVGKWKNLWQNLLHKSAKHVSKAKAINPKRKKT